MIRVLLYIDFPVRATHKDDLKKAAEINKSLMEKINGTFFNLPFLPTKDMSFNLLGFSKVFNYTDEEFEWLEQQSNISFEIDSIVIHFDYLEINLK